MKTFSEIFSQHKKILSFEFFPPKKIESIPNTKDLMKRLNDYAPDFMTVTYGAGGGTREFTKDLVSYLCNELSCTAVSHLTCVGHSESDLQVILESLRVEGIRNILALRGDAHEESQGFDFLSCARDLVRYIAERYDFSLAVAGYPEMHKDALSLESELMYLKEKQDAGASLIITQLFFDNNLYFAFLENAKAYGITIPIIPGIMPISNVAQLERFTAMCGASIPEELLSELKEHEQDKDAVIEIGTRHAVIQSIDLLEKGAPGIHYYTLNKHSQISSVLSQVGHLF